MRFLGRYVQIHSSCQLACPRFVGVGGGGVGGGDVGGGGGGGWVVGGGGGGNKMLDRIPNSPLDSCACLS